MYEKDNQNNFEHDDTFAQTSETSASSYERNSGDSGYQNPYEFHQQNSRDPYAGSPYGSYHSEQYDAPRWQPDPEKYNTTYRTNVKKHTRKKRRWIAPLAIVLAVIVAAAAVLLIIRPGTFGIGTNRSLSAEGIESALVEETTGAVTADENNVVWTDIETTEDISKGIVLTDVSDIVDEVFPAVVSITSRTLIDNNNYYNFFFGGQLTPYGDSGSGEKQEVESGIGSGTIIGQNDEELLILTSYHVVDGASSLAVTFVNGTSIDGVVKSASDETDIAIVSVPLDDIDDDTMSSIRMAKLSTKPAEMGEGVIVIGNAMGYGMSVTTGIVSAVDRQLTIEGKTLSLIQTDAAINSGNSGGCMLNSKGELIGISEAKITVSTVEGMCYAIPISSNAELIQDLLAEETPENATGDTHSQSTGAYLGIRGRDITSDLANAYDMPQGVYIISVVTGGGAEEAGLEDGDIITALDGQDTTTMSKLQYELSKHSEGDEVEVTVMRNSGNGYAQATFTVKLTGLIS